MYEIFIPKSEILQKYIYNFYVMKEFSGGINYLAFPQLGMTMALFVDANFTFENDCVSIRKELHESPTVLLLGKYNLPIQIKYAESVPEISINFTPSGLNYFFKKDTFELAQKQAQLVEEEQWKDLTKEIFQQETDEKKMEILENFLLKNIIEKEISTAETFISLLEDNPEYSVSRIAEQLKISTKTLNRSFARFIGCSPMDFKQILRFRKAVNTKFENPEENLTQICFDSNFYDSPHFTREFKKLTNLNPRDFFADIKPVADKDIPYQFL